MNLPLHNILLVLSVPQIHNKIRGKIMKWQPIETAPREIDHEILACDKMGEINVIMWDGDKWIHGYTHACLTIPPTGDEKIMASISKEGFDEICSAYPVQWMPLPKLPELTD